jgi:hypothetical protein
MTIEPPQEGTHQWMSQLHDNAALHIRALHQINQALQSALKLQEAWTSLEGVVHSALFISTVVHYTRPFTNNRGAKGFRKYDVVELKKNAAFDQKLHDHLLYMRNTLVAHQDGVVLKVNIGQSRIGVREAGEDTLLRIETFATVNAIYKIAKKEVIGIYIDHFKACISTIEESFKHALMAVDVAKRQYGHV